MATSRNPMSCKAFFLQEEDEDADADPQTSEGLYIDDTSLALN